ncbi:MAG: MMPL family transporter [Lachnospiraceae bacterium]|nr:MMPL family transporter [Lachnospiraceae bacterium]
MVAFGKKIVKYRVVVLILAILLLIPAGLGYIHTRVNYDLLSYLPESLETVKGQNIMVDEYGMGAFSMIILENMESQDVVKLESKIEKVDHVKKVLSYNDFASDSLPRDMLPNSLKKAMFNGDAQIMIAMFDDTTSSDNTMQAITDIRKLCKKQAFVSGMGGVTTDIKDLVDRELPSYVAIAVILSIILLLIFTDSYVVPFLFLTNIGIAIVYNMGTNFILKDVSYLTKALAAILQLAVTMDYSIFLLESYQHNKTKYGDDRERAMAHAISNTFTSITASSVTTVAGFAALMVMVFKLGANIGVVMIKGVIFGVFSCITILPAIILVFDKVIDKTSHKPLIGSLEKLSGFILKHRWIIVVVFAIIFVPAMYGNSHYKVYYNIAKSLPDSLPSAKANKKLEEEFNMKTTHVLMIKRGLSVKDKKELIESVEDVKGVNSVLGINSLVGSTIPESMLPARARDALQSKNYEIMFVSSDYGQATDEGNRQIEDIDKIIKGYQKDAMLIGEGPLMNDLQKVNDVDIMKVNILSIGAIFIIILFTFKSISLPVILVALIEFAIAINMAIPFYMNTSLPFVASVVIGTVQLGSTVDYAILFTSNYMKWRVDYKQDKAGAIKSAQKFSVKSILTSGLCFFGATFGVATYSNIDMISSLCMLLARGAFISMIIVIFLLPAVMWIMDPIIIRTTLGMRKENIVERDKTAKESIA